MNIEVHFVGYLHIMDLINAWKMEHIKITSLFLISNFHSVLIVVFFLLADSLASKFYVPTFWNRQFSDTSAQNSDVGKSPRRKNITSLLFFCSECDA
jgi:hypothetical protein